MDVKRTVALACACAAALLAVGVHAQPTPRLVQGKVYVLSPADGNGSNVVVQSGPDGVMLVDMAIHTFDAARFAAVRSLSPEPIRWIVNTSARVDHMGGNDALTRLGTTPGSVGRTRVVAHQNVVHRLVGNASVSRDAWPNDDFFTPDKDFFFNSEAVVVTHMPAATSDGDSIVFFRRSDVIVAGDVSRLENIPPSISRPAAACRGIDALNTILHVAVLGSIRKRTYIVPGHGRICDEADVVEYRDMVAVVRDRIQDLIKKGSSLEQVKAAKPSRDYDPGWRAAAVRRRIRLSTLCIDHWRNDDSHRALIALAPHVWRSHSRPDAEVRCSAERRASRVVDFSGYCVGGHRRLALAHGDADQRRLRGIPLNAEGRRVGRLWIHERRRCGRRLQSLWRSAISIPGRLHITWQDDRTLQIEADSGTQTRLLHFGGKPPANAKATWQGYWSRTGAAYPRQRHPLPGLGATTGASGRSLEVVDAAAPATCGRTDHLQRERCHPTFRSLERTQRRHLVRRDDNRRRSARFPTEPFVTSINFKNRRTPRDGIRPVSRTKNLEVRTGEIMELRTKNWRRSCSARHAE